MARLKTSPERFSNSEKLRIHILLIIRAKQEQTRISRDSCVAKSFVAQTGRLRDRGLAIRGAIFSSRVRNCARRLTVGDTAGCQPALRRKSIQENELHAGARVGE